MVVAPPFMYIDQVKSSLTDRIEISGQNCWTGKGGAFTGEIRLSSHVKLNLNQLMRQSCFVLRYMMVFGNSTVSFRMLICSLS